MHRTLTAGTLAVLSAALTGCSLPDPKPLPTYSYTPPAPPSAPAARPTPASVTMPSLLGVHTMAEVRERLKIARIPVENLTLEPMYEGEATVPGATADTRRWRICFQSYTEGLSVYAPEFTNVRLSAVREAHQCPETAYEDLDANGRVRKVPVPDLGSDSGSNTSGSSSGGSRNGGKRRH
ncbi:hypothetical protein [Streptomyces sp. NPDC089799]|uniref:hypothetical protein n=1 Tax=Streptomyces sp. NPDC089799 TaxID=3155066 RepID=UPI0034375966